MYPWISRTLDFWLQFCEKKCGLYMDVYGIFGGVMSVTGLEAPNVADVEGFSSAIGSKQLRLQTLQQPDSNAEFDLLQAFTSDIVYRFLRYSLKGDRGFKQEE